MLSGPIHIYSEERSTEFGETYFQAYGCWIAIYVVAIDLQVLGLFCYDLWRTWKSPLAQAFWNPRWVISKSWMGHWSLAVELNCYCKFMWRVVHQKKVAGMCVTASSVWEPRAGLRREKMQLPIGRTLCKILWLFYSICLWLVFWDTLCSEILYMSY